MALVFPSNPSVNDTYQVNGRTYVWNGTSWRTVKGGVPDVVPTLSVDNDFSAGGTLHIDSTNNEIGIGTGTPSHQLHLTQDLGVDGNLIVGGTITVPTPVAGTNDTKVATTAFVGDAVSTAVSGLLDGAPAALDTLNELAAALDDDENYAATITTALAGKIGTTATFGGDVSGTYDNIVISDDSHNHIIGNVDGLQTALDAKQAASTALTTSTSFAGDVSGTYNAIVVADDSHNHIISNVDGLQTALDGKLSLTGGTVTGGIVASGGISGLDLNNGISGSNFNITGVNQITINDPGEGIVWGGGASGNISLFVVDDASDDILRTDARALQVGTSTVWHAGNDGSGSGLDADTLDGSHASAFAASSHTHSYAATSHTHSYLPLSGGTLTGTLTYTLLSGPTSQTRDKIRVWNSSAYTIGMQSGYTYGHLNDYAMTFQMNNDSDRGFWWGDASHTNAQGAMSLTTNGRLTVATSLSVGQGESVTAPSTTTLYSSGDALITGRLDVSGRIYPDNWIQFDEHEGLYSPLNGAHFYPNNGSYGSWRVSGSRNGWEGLEFDGCGPSSNQNWSFMMTAANNYSGVHNNSVGWMWYFNYQDLYCNSYRGFNNVAGTGNASYHPSGIYSTGTNWLYGQIITNNNSINAGSGVITCGEINQNGGTVNDLYGETKFRYVSTSNDWSAQPVQEISSQDCGYACRSFDSDTHTGQLRAASGTWYARSHNDGSYWTLAAVIANQSSRHLKQDIETWGVSKPLSSAVNVAYETTATDLLNKLRVVSYRWKKQDALPADIPSERRSDALDRLNRIRRAQGLDQYDGDEAIHKCGRDCDASEENPCDMYRNWERGTLGLVAEEVGEVIPEVTNIDLYQHSSTKGQNTAIDGLALTSMCVKAIQELSARNAELEERLSQLEAGNV